MTSENDSDYSSALASNRLMKDSEPSKALAIAGPNESDLQCLLVRARTTFVCC